MKYNYMVKYGGVYYAAGKEVPVPDETEKPEVSVDEDVETGENNEVKKPGRKPKAAGQ